MPFGGRGAEDAANSSFSRYGSFLIGSAMELKLKLIPADLSFLMTKSRQLGHKCECICDLSNWLLHAADIVSLLLINSTSMPISFDFSSIQSGFKRCRRIGINPMSIWL